MGAKPRATPSRRSRMRIRATVVARQVGDGPLFIDGPGAFVDQIPGSARVAVTGRLNGVAFASALIPLGGKRRLVPSQALVATSGLYAGASATLELSEADEPGLGILPLDHADPNRGE